MKPAARRSYAKGEFIPRLEPAHDRIHELESQLGVPLSDLSELYNIDTANEEIERLEKRLEKRSFTPQPASPRLLSAQPTFQREELPSYQAGTGMARLIASIKKTNP